MSKLICSIFVFVYFFVVNNPAFSLTHKKAGINKNSEIINTGSKTELQKHPEQVSYAENVHMYIGIEALKLLKMQFPQYDFSIFNTFIGTMNDIGPRPWQMARLTTGLYREDSEDPVFDIRGAFGFYTSNSHFWDADDRTDEDNSLTVLDLGTIQRYPNAYTKVNRYIDGQWFSWNGNGYGGRRFIEYNPGSGTFYRFSYHTRGLIEFYKTNRICQESHINTLGEVVYDRREVTVSNLVKNRIVWEVLGRIIHLASDMTVPAHTRGDVHVREWDGGDCYHNFADDGGYNLFNATTAWNSGGFIDPYLNNNDPIRYIMYTANQLANHYPSGPDCSEIPQQHFGNNNLPGGTNAMINDYYQSLGPSPIFINDVNMEAQYCFNHAIRASAAMLYWFAIETGIFPNVLPTPPHIVNFSKTLPDNFIYNGERLQITCGATGDNLNYNWFFKVCDTTNECGVNIPGLQFSQEGNKLYIYNNNFKDKWTCSKYDSLCNAGNSFSLAPQPMTFILGVRVSNSIGSETKYFNFVNNYHFRPNERLRPPPDPVTGCPILLIDTGGQFVYENNVLKSSQNTKNLNSDVEDKYILGSNPYLSENGKCIQLALKEVSNDYNYIDEISLTSIDFPTGKSPGITENNEIILYSKNDIQSVSSAFLSEKDVSKTLAFDTAFSNKVTGYSGDRLDLEFNIQRINSANSENSAENVMLMFDPEYYSNSLDPVIKSVSGNVLIKDEDGNIDSKNIFFNMRQKRSEVFIPALIKKKVKSVNIDWLKNFELSYFATVNAHYSGFTEKKLNLLSAEDLNQGNVTNLLNSENKIYSELDSTSHIILKFLNDNRTVPPGMERKYVFTIKGRSVKGDIKQKNILSEEVLGKNVNRNKTNMLFDNYPNPFNPTTKISYELQVPNYVSVTIYNILGKEVGSLVNQNQVAGSYEVEFDGSKLSSGVYFYKIQAGDFIAVKKMTLIK